MVISRVDYCNSLIYGTDDRNFVRLQHLQHAAAWPILGLSKRARTIPTLCNLHWVPVRERCPFKLMTLTHRALHGTAPVYLRELVALYVSAWDLRSTTARTIDRPRTNGYFGDASFVATAADLWNDLPFSLRAVSDEGHFKQALKAHYSAVGLGSSREHDHGYMDRYACYLSFLITF